MQKHQLACKQNRLRSVRALCRRQRYFSANRSMSSKHTVLGRATVVFVINDVFNLAMLWWCGVPTTLYLQLVTMKTILALTVFFLLRCEGGTLKAKPSLNNRPIIGILSQEQSYKLKDVYAEENYMSYIAASYVKSVEAAGARVVPIMIGKSRQYYEELLGKINGVLFPGGATWFNQTDGFADAGEHIYQIAKSMNDAGDHFPIFGTCLGFELLIVLASNREENRESCHAFGNWPITFTKDFRSSKMFREIDDDIVDSLTNQKIAINAHQFCILDENMLRHNLTVDWRVTSHSVDKNGLKYISSVEHKRYPFFGVQFHPEKAAFEWKSSKTYAHTRNAIKANGYFMDFFVQECRKNFHRFESENEENEHLIYNYIPTFTGEKGSQYVQCYFFEPRGVVSKL